MYEATNALCQRDWSRRNPGYVQAWQRDNPEKMREYRRRWREKNKQKIRAHKIVGNEVRRGRLTPGSCDCCGSTDTKAHHEDYNKPLEVVWVCATRHGELHRKH